jgi:hemolysin D
LEATQQFVETQAAQKSALQKIEIARAAILSLREQRTQINAEYVRTAFSDLSKAREQEGAAFEALKKSEKRKELSSIASPVDGTISQIFVHTLGAVVSPAQQLVTIVPLDSVLNIEAVLSNQESGFVSIGQEAEVKIDAFPFTRHGLLQAHVINVSEDSESQPNGPETQMVGSIRRADTASLLEGSERLVYYIRLKLDDDQPAFKVDLKKLRAGMSVRVEVKTGRRTVLNYITSPVSEYLRQSLMER